MCEIFIASGLELSNVFELLSVAELYAAFLLKTKCIHLLAANYKTFQNQKEFRDISKTTQKQIESMHKNK
jgi:hypothetical protein